MWVSYLNWEDPLDEGTATHSSILACRIPWTEEPGKLQSIGSQRVHGVTTSPTRLSNWTSNKDPVQQCNRRRNMETVLSPHTPSCIWMGIFGQLIWVLFVKSRVDRIVRLFHYLYNSPSHWQELFHKSLKASYLVCMCQLRLLYAKYKQAN